MALNKFGFIFTGEGLDPCSDRAVIEKGQFSAIIIGMSNPDGVEKIAQELVQDGVQLIELCGGFGPLWTSRVINAIKNRIPVGSVGYGPESINMMAELFPAT